MAGKKVVVPREKELPRSTLLAAVGLTEEQWEIYLAVLNRPDVDDLEPSPESLEVLAERGLMRRDPQRSLGFAAVPPGPAFSALMERYDEEMLRKMQAGMALRKLMRGVGEGGSATRHADDGSGVEVYEDVNEARDRIYELSDRSTDKAHFLLETRFRSLNSAQVVSNYQRSRPADIQMDDLRLLTAIVDKHARERANADREFLDHWTERLDRGERTLAFPGQLPQMMLRTGSHLVLWRDPYPSRSATLVITSPWALRLASSYVHLVVLLCEPWAPPDPKSGE